MRTRVLSGMLAVLAVASVVFMWFTPLLDLAESGVKKLFYP